MREHRKCFRVIPQHEILESGETNNWRPAEHAWIERYRAEGRLLLNKTAGRNGNESLSEESRRKLSAAFKGRKVSEETRRLMSLAQKGLKKEYSEEGRRKQMANLERGGQLHNTSPEFLRRTWQLNLAKHSFTSEAATEHNLKTWSKRTPEQRSAVGQKIAAARSRNHSPEQLAAIASANGRKLYEKDPDARARVGERMRVWWRNATFEEKRDVVARRMASRVAKNAAP